MAASFEDDSRSSLRPSLRSTTPHLQTSLMQVPANLSRSTQAETTSAARQIAFRLMKLSDVPAVVSLFAKHLSEKKDPFYPLRGLPLQYYMDLWRALIVKCVARQGVIAVAVQIDSSARTSGHKRQPLESVADEEVGDEQVVCAMMGMAFDAFLEIDKEDFQHGNREAERAVYDKMFDALIRDPPCALSRLLFVVGAVVHPSSQSKGIASRTSSLGLSIARKRGFEVACADLLHQDACHGLINKLAYRPFKGLRAPFRSVVLPDGTRPFKDREDVPEYAVILCKDLSGNQLAARSRL